MGGAVGRADPRRNRPAGRVLKVRTMNEPRPEQQRTPAKKLTPELVRNNPLLAKLARIRLTEIKAVRAAKKATEFDFD